VTLRLQTAVLLLLALFSVNCGYVMAGKWEDDPANWKRAFHFTKPPEVTVVHSLYWRSPHWSYEAGYFFEVAPNAGVEKQLFTQNKLRRV
jgi:hypothetical protein